MEEVIIPQMDMSFMEVDENANEADGNVKWPQKRGGRKPKEL